MVKIKILDLKVQMWQEGELGRLRDDGWMVDGSGGWRVDSRSPKREKSKTRGGKINKG